MKILKNLLIENPVYFVLNLGGEIYSGIGGELKIQEIHTIRGKQLNIWLKGEFSEKERHSPMKRIPFELNIYLED